MQQDKTEDRYSRETLLPMNTLYDHEHCLTQEDVDAANALVHDETPAAAPVENTPAEETPANNNDTANDTADPNNGCLGDEGLFN